MANNCKHIKCGTCGGVKLKHGFIGVTLNEVCSGKCLNAAKDACSCKCQGKFHQGNNSKLLDEILNPKKKKIVAKKVKKSVKKIQYFEPETIKDEVALFIQGKRFKTDSFDRFSDRNLRKDQKNLALNWLSKNGQSLDVVALDFLNLTNYNFDESYIIDLITEIILQYPSGIKQYIADAIEDKNNRLLAENELANQNYYSSVFDNEEQNEFETSALRFELNGVNKMKLKKGSAAAKAFMAKIRAKKNKVGVVPARIKKVPADASTSTYKRDKNLYAKLLSDYNKYSGLYEDATASNKKILKAKLNKIEDVLNKYERKNIISGGLNSVEVIFANPKYNYTTDVSASTTEASAKKYFVGTMFNVGVYPIEKFEKCIAIRFNSGKIISGFKKGNTRFIEKGEKPFKTKKTILVKRRITIKPKGTFKKFTTINGTKKDISMKPNIKFKVGNLPTYKDEDAAREIQLFANNDSQLYFQRKKPILINLSKKHKKGIYDVAKAAKLFRYFIDAAMQKYNKDFGSRGDSWSKLLSVADRNVLANDYAINTLFEFELGNYTEK